MQQLLDEHDDLEEWHERAAILEYMQGNPRYIAEFHAFITIAATGRYALSVKQAAELLSTTERQIRDAIKKRHLHPTTTPGDTTISIPNLIAWANQTKPAHQLTKPISDAAQELDELLNS